VIQQRPLDTASISPYYYHDNINELIEFVVENYNPLLDCCESHFYKTYRSLTDSAQQLYCRLLLRKNDYFRKSKITYPEIGNTEAALAELQTFGLCTHAEVANVRNWIALFRREEIQSMLPHSAQTFKNAWLTEFNPEILARTDLLGFTPVDLLQQTDSVYRIELKHAFITFQLLFFGNLHQDISALVLRDLGLTRFETTIQKDFPLPFTSRAQLLAHKHYYECIDKYDEVLKTDVDLLLELHQKLWELPVDIIHKDSALKRRLHKWSNRIARQLERLGAIDIAMAIYKTVQLPPARERWARIEAKLGNKHSALTICKTIMDNPQDSAELDFAEQFAQPLARQLKVDIPKIEKYKPPSVALTLPATNLPVEYATALYYAKSGKCFYVENALVTGVFGLAMWDIIFSPVTGAFFHPFQTAPADFHDPEFVLRRKHLFEQRLQEIQAAGLNSIVLGNLHCKTDVNNPLVNWYALDRQIIVLALKRIPLSHWLAFFEYILGDIPAHRSGLPDLVYFSDTGGYTLLEVKGPGDQLQKNQRRWMKHFAEHNIPHAVVAIELTHAEPDCFELTGSHQ